MDLDQKIVEMDMFLGSISSLTKQHIWQKFMSLQMPSLGPESNIW